MTATTKRAWYAPYDKEMLYMHGDIVGMLPDVFYCKAVWCRGVDPMGDSSEMCWIRWEDLDK